MAKNIQLVLNLQSHRIRLSDLKLMRSNNKWKILHKITDQINRKILETITTK